MGLLKAWDWTVKRWWGRLTHFTASRAEKALEGIQSAEEFSKILRRERERADRNHHQFSLLVYNVDLMEKDRTLKRLVNLADVLARRLRCIDETGWLAGRRIGVLLPETPPEGAWKLAEDISRLVEPVSPPPECAVFSYPVERKPAEERQSSPVNQLVGSQRS